jgi:hypothetical protein
VRRIGGVERGSEELLCLVEAAGPDEVQHPRIEGRSPIRPERGSAGGEQLGPGLGEEPHEHVDLLGDGLGEAVAEP